eukprot:COSAG02_NODE_2662_length_8303_cov_7.299976_5_plen_181_part_00
MWLFVWLVRTLQAWGTGYNGNGQLGLGDTTDRTSPTLLPSPTRVVQVAAGYEHTMLLDEYGRVRALLLGALCCNVPRAVCEGVCRCLLRRAVCGFFVWLVRTPQAWATGYNWYGQLGLGDTTDRNSPTLLPSPTRVVQVAAGWDHTMLLDEDGRVRALLLGALCAMCHARCARACAVVCC